MDERRMNMTRGRIQRAPEPMLRMPPSNTEIKKRPSGNRVGSFLKKRWWVLLIVVVLLAGIVVLCYAYLTTRNQLTKLSSNSQNDVQQLTKQIGTYLQLPDESPTLATVSDVGKLKSQDFFKNAQNGDKVLIFSKSGRALLYRPSTQKIIEYSKVNFGGTKAPQQQ